MLPATTTNHQMEGIQETEKGLKNRRKRCTRSMACYSHNPSQDHQIDTNHWCKSTDFSDAPSTAAGAIKQSLTHACQFSYMQSTLPPSMSKGTPTTPEEEKTKTSQKPQRNGWSVTQQWSRMRAGIGRRTGIRSGSARSVDGCHQKTASEAYGSQSQAFASKENSGEQLDTLNNLNYAHLLSGHDSQHINTNWEHHSMTSLSRNYQPRSFEDIVGHEIIIRVLSNAVQRKKVAQLYLFHGPSGTGKTSTARLFAMALHCESPSLNKPCWSCRGCSRSLYIMDLCSGRRTSGFQKIRTLLQNMAFIQEVPGFKVFIIEESHSLTAEAWDELLGMLENTYNATLVFVLITVDASMIPESILSRCQKFNFFRIKNMDVTLKLARIVAQEEIAIEDEALKLIIAKAEGSLREAEYILDQLTLLGPRINSSMVQQFVGLVPQYKLINLLEAALSGDAKKTVINIRELIATGIEAQTIVFQLASLIADIVSGAAIAIPNSSTLAGSSNDKRLPKNESKLSNAKSERLCLALKMLIEAEKQPRGSIDPIAWIYAALLEITSGDISDGMHSGISLPTGDQKLSHHRSWANYHSFNETPEQQHMEKGVLNKTNGSNENTAHETIEMIKCRGKAVEREFNFPHMRDMEEIWMNILQNVQSIDVQEFLSSHVKLASLTISSANAIVHLMFKRAEDKLAAQMSEESLSKALKGAIGCPVIMNMSLEPVDKGIIQECSASINKCQITEFNYSRQQQQKPFLPQLMSNRSHRAMVPQTTDGKLAPGTDNRSRLTQLKHGTLLPQGPDRSPEGETEATTAWQPHISAFSGHLMQNQLETSVGPHTNSLERDQFPIDIGVAHIIRTEKPQHRWPSLSSTQQSDASIEPYSQDILFENANIHRESRIKGSPKLHQDSNIEENDSKIHIRLFHSWSCKEGLCQRKTRGRTRQHHC